MHAVSHRRHVLTFLIPTLLAGLGLVGNRVSRRVGRHGKSVEWRDHGITEDIGLIGRRATQQLIATARATDGSVQDATRARSSGSAGTRRLPWSLPRVGSLPGGTGPRRSSPGKGARSSRSPSGSRGWNGPRRSASVAT